MSVVLPTVTVRGRFVTKSGPLEGIMWLLPHKIAFEIGDRLYATAAYAVELNDGAFEVELAQMRYRVFVPKLGSFTIKPHGPGPLLMADLMPKKWTRS